MATGNLTPQEMQQLQELLGMGGNTGWVPDFTMSAGGQTYQPLQDRMGGSDGTVSNTGFLRYGEGQTKPGQSFDVYDTQGAYQNSGQFKDMSGFDPLLAAFLAAAGGMAAFLPGGFAAGSAAGGAGAGAAEGVSGAAFGDAGLMYGGADAAAAGSLGAAEGAGLGSATYGATGGPSAFMQGAGITGGTGAASALTGSSALTSGLAAGGGGFLSGLAGSGWLGPLATLAGGVLGSKSRDQSQTTRSEIDPRMVPYMYGNSGIMPMAQQIAMRQMSDPRISGAYQQMRDTGGFLMSRPVAGNGYTQRYGSR